MKTHNRLTAISIPLSRASLLARGLAGDFNVSKDWATFVTCGCGVDG